MSILPHHQLIANATTIGRNKIAIPLPRLAILGIMAGAFIALGGTLSVIIGFGFPEITASNPALQRLLSGLMFPIGLFLIVHLGCELFTGNNAVLIPAYTSRHYNTITLLRHWTLVWIFNFIGALAFTYLFVYISQLTANEPYHTAIIRIAESKTALSPITAFIKGIAANWCVCLAVWLCLMVDTLPAKFLACWIPVGAFVMLGYEHSIANMFFIPAGMLEGANVSILDLFRNLIPVTIGNLLGGALLVGIPYTILHSQKKVDN